MSSLQTPGKHIAKAIWRGDSKNPLSKGISIVNVNYDDKSSLASALRDQRLLIITMTVFTPPNFQKTIITAAGKADVPYMRPNNWRPT